MTLISFHIPYDFIRIAYKISQIENQPYYNVFHNVLDAREILWHVKYVEVILNVLSDEKYKESELAGTSKISEILFRMIPAVPVS